MQLQKILRYDITQTQFFLDISLDFSYGILSLKCRQVVQLELYLDAVISKGFFSSILRTYIMI